jgi:iron complex outermembrane receptor protein
MLCSGVVSAHAAVKHAPENEYLDLDITQLMQITITSVSKKPQVLADTPTAVFVITADDIHRSGITSLPEALRMVPGLQVSRVGAEKWAVTARGFNGQTANKLLVLMDGRTLYSPAFSGVYWNEQDTMLEDIDRIEVIRGPGGTIWGANAVNGIINIILSKYSRKVN